MSSAARAATRRLQRLQAKVSTGGLKESAVDPKTGFLLHCPGLNGRGCGNTIIGGFGWFKDSDSMNKSLMQAGWCLAAAKVPDANGNERTAFDPICDKCAPSLEKQIVSGVRAEPEAG